MTVNKLLSGSIAALVTPMRSDGKIDLAAWERLLEWHVQSGTHGVVVGGTTGESACLQDHELKQLTELAVQGFAKHGKVIMGVGSPSTAKSVSLLSMAEHCAADAVLAVTPYYNRPPQIGLQAHYLELAENSALPVIVYNVPGRTGVDLEPTTFANLKKHRNIRGIKEANAVEGRLTALLNLPGRDVSILSGDDDSACCSLLAGADGVISVAANVVPRSFAKLCTLAMSGSSELALELDSQLRDLYDFLGWCNPIPTKWYLSRLGIMQSGIRAPLVWLPQELQQRAEKVYEQYQVLENFEN